MEAGDTQLAIVVASCCGSVALMFAGGSKALSYRCEGGFADCLHHDRPSLTIFHRHLLWPSTVGSWRSRAASVRAASSALRYPSSPIGKRPCWFIRLC